MARIAARITILGIHCDKLTRFDDERDGAQSCARHAAMRMPVRVPCSYAYAYRPISPPAAGTEHEYEYEYEYERVRVPSACPNPSPSPSPRARARR
jgi:hypothetical protein